MGLTTVQISELFSKHRRNRLQKLKLGTNLEKNSTRFMKVAKYTATEQMLKDRLADKVKYVNFKGNERYIFLLKKITK